MLISPSISLYKKRQHAAQKPTCHAAQKASKPCWILANEQNWAEMDKSFHTSYLCDMNFNYEEPNHIYPLIRINSTPFFVCVTKQRNHVKVHIGVNYFIKVLRLWFSTQKQHEHSTGKGFALRGWIVSAVMDNKMLFLFRVLLWVKLHLYTGRLYFCHLCETFSYSG